MAVTLGGHSVLSPQQAFTHTWCPRAQVSLHDPCPVRGEQQAQIPPSGNTPARMAESSGPSRNLGEGSACLRLGLHFWRISGAIQEERVQAEEGDDSPGRGGGPVRLRSAFPRTRR